MVAFFGCQSNILDCEEEPFVHTCPDKGHGNCPICYDPYRNENQETIVLDR